jgi:hypothetical protein
MRIVIPLLLATTLAALPAMAGAQQLGAGVDAAEDAADTNAAPVEVQGRSAFGRVMDVMIAALVQQHGHTGPQARTADPGRTLQPRAATLPVPPRRKAKKPAPGIDISLGAAFALPAERHDSD